MTSLTRKKLYSTKRHWYHLSSTLKRLKVKLIPWDSVSGLNRTLSEPDGDRICVAPTIEQCIVAIPYTYHSIFSIYRTESMVNATNPDDVFDSGITHEGWILEPTTFIKIGTINFENVETQLKLYSVTPEAASIGEVSVTRKALKWWKNTNIKQFIKYNYGHSL